MVWIDAQPTTGARTKGVDQQQRAPGDQHGPLQVEAAGGVFGAVVTGQQRERADGHEERRSGG